MRLPFTEQDRRAMRLAISLARRAEGCTRPNPMVGAVLLKAGRVVGRGWHHRAGQAHAEVEAIRDAGANAKGATLYVTLEPCCHHGRTGPCTLAIVAAGVSRVVVGCRDPNPLVDGGGIRLLRRRGLSVILGCLEDECQELVRSFATWVTERRPLVTLKYAATLDGFIADGRSTDRRSVWITGEEAHAAAHAMRAGHDAVLVGAGTVRDDDPLLTVRMARLPNGRPQPLRIVLDGALRTPASARVVTPIEDGPATLIVAAEGAPASRVRALQRAGAEVLVLSAKQGRIAPSVLLRALGERAIQSLLIEGGATVHSAFIEAGQVDRVALFFAPRLLGGGVPISRGLGLPLESSLTLDRPVVRPLGNDLLLEANVTKASPSRRKENRGK